jgi:non-heme chloroperoxidase
LTLAVPASKLAALGGKPMTMTPSSPGGLLAAAGIAVTLLAGSVSAAEPSKDSFQTNDGYTLNYLEAGQGKTIVMIPGWSQTAAEFHKQMPLADTYHIIAIDMRGHGDSSKGEYGYRIHRLSKDVHDFLVAKNLNDVTLLGHSMGASVIWGYWDLYRNERLARIIIDDQVAACANNPGWSEQQKNEAGGLWDPNGLYATANSIGGPDGEKVSAGFVAGMFTKAFPHDELEWVIAENLKFPREAAARMVVNHCMTDWRDLFPTITVPTLIIGGRGSFFKIEALQWIQSQIPGARLEVFSVEEGGSHFTFLENPQKFNAIVRDFVQ